MAGRRILCASLVLVGLTGGCSDDSAPSEVQRIVVPNEVIADLVSRVACTEDRLDVEVEPVTAGPPPVIRLTLEPDDDGEGPQVSDPAPLVLVLTDVVPTIDGANGAPDPMFWLDPTRVVELTSAIGGALVVAAGLDGAMVDRCIERVRTQMELLDADIAEQLADLDETERVIDIDVAGAVYFAVRYDFTSSSSPRATDASELLATGDLGGAASYDEMMRDHVGQVVDVLQRP